MEIRSRIAVYNSDNESARQRLKFIIDYAYQLFCHQVVGGVIQIENEASMQLHLSNILLQLGRLNVFSADEYFNIELEKKIDLDHETSKSKNKKARVDIWIEFKKGDAMTSASAIELKYLRKSQKKNAAVTDARHSVYKDLENLEQYATQFSDLYICEIVCTDNHNFVDSKAEKFSISDGTVISTYKGVDSTYDDIILTKHYDPILWDQLGKYNFLKLCPN